MKGGAFMNINKLIGFEVTTAKSKKGNTYYAIIMRIGDVTQYLKFITKAQYDNIVSQLKKGD